MTQTQEYQARKRAMLRDIKSGKIRMPIDPIPARIGFKPVSEDEM
jgi:hypothetical protein